MAMGGKRLRGRGGMPLGTPRGADHGEKTSLNSGRAIPHVEHGCSPVILRTDQLYARLAREYIGQI